MQDHEGVSGERPEPPAQVREVLGEVLEGGGEDDGILGEAGRLELDPRVRGERDVVVLEDDPQVELAAAFRPVVLGLVAIWQLEPMIRLNKPQDFSPDEPPRDLLP